MGDRVRNAELLCLPIGKKYGLSTLQPLHKKYRSNFEIIGLVLEAVKASSATPFSIMKHAHHSLSDNAVIVGNKNPDHATPIN